MSRQTCPCSGCFRDVLNLKGTKFGCGIGQCGACTVHVRRPRRARLPDAGVGGERRAITTIEGPVARRHRIRCSSAWQEIDVPQCGYCQAGQIMSAAALLATTPKPTDARDRHRDERQPLPLRHLHCASAKPFTARRRSRRQRSTSTAQRRAARVRRTP